MEERINSEMNPRGYLLEEFRLFHLVDAKGTEMEFHYHEFYKVVMLLSGSGKYTVEDRHYELREGDIVLIGSHQVHRPEFAPGMEYERIVFYISPEFLQRQSVPECNLEELFNDTRGHVLRLEEKRFRKLFGLAVELETELTGAQYGGSVLGTGLLLQLLVRLGREKEKGIIREQTPVLILDKRIREISDYIETHLTEELAMEELSERFFISKYHMMRLFKKETGRTVYEYITERRLVLAKELLRRGMPATEVCFQSGFGSYSSFTRAYGKRFGTTPTGRHGKYLVMDEMFMNK